jgi:hypothetical protein
MKYIKSDWVAAYAATISTVLMIIEVLRFYRNRPAISIDIEPAMQKIGAPNGQITHMKIDIRNSGVRPTTVEWVMLCQVKGILDRIRGRFLGALFSHKDIDQDSRPDEVPKKLEQYDKWTWLHRYSGSTVDVAQARELFVVAKLSHKKKPIPVKVPTYKVCKVKKS